MKPTASIERRRAAACQDSERVIRERFAEQIVPIGKRKAGGPASAGHGLNLQSSGSETIIWYGLTNNLELYQQLNARLIGGHRRTGKNVVIHHIVAEDTVDIDMIGLLANKDATQEDLKIALSEKARHL